MGFMTLRVWCVYAADLLSLQSWRGGFWELLEVVGLCTACARILLTGAAVCSLSLCPYHCVASWLRPDSAVSLT